MDNSLYSYTQKSEFAASSQITSNFEVRNYSHNHAISPVSNGLCHAHQWVEIYWSWLHKMFFSSTFTVELSFMLKKRRKNLSRKELQHSRCCSCVLHCVLFFFSFSFPPSRSIFAFFSFLSQTVKELTRLRIYPQQWLQFCCACQNLYGH